MSLMGAVAYSLLSQFWIAVYVVALQRRAHNPQVTHMRRLNAVVRKLQSMPQLLVYRRMKPTGVLVVHTDSGFSKETDHKGFSIRGSNVFRLGVNAKGEAVAHLIEPACRSHTWVARPAYAAELLAAAAGCDDAMPSVVTPRELVNGSPAARQAVLLRVTTEATATSCSSRSMQCLSITQLWHCA